MESGVEFEAADFPNANRLTVHILSAVAEHEAKMISERTKSALAAAKARGTMLGGDRGYRPANAPDAGAATAVRKRQADHAAFVVLPTVERLQARGTTSLNAIARELSARASHPEEQRQASFGERRNERRMDGNGGEAPPRSGGLETNS